MSLYDITGWESIQSLATGTLAEKSQSEVIADYNRWQTPFAFVITLLVSFTQFLRWKHTEFKDFGRQILLSLVSAFVLTVLTAWYFGLVPDLDNFGIILLFFGCWWAITGNLDYLIRVTKGNLKVSGSSIAHVGFGLILLGAAVSTSQSEKISQNSSLTDIKKLNKEFDNREDILLFQDASLIMGDYYVSYVRKYQDGVNVKFEVDYHDLAPKNYMQNDLIYVLGEVYRAKEDHPAGMDMMQDLSKYWELFPNPEAQDLARTEIWSPYGKGDKLFTLEPLIQMNPKFGNVPEPDTKHYWHKDVYTHVRYAQLDTDETEKDADGYLPYKDHSLALGDTLRSGARLAILDSILSVKDYRIHGLDSTDLAVRAKLRVISPNDDPVIVEPLFVLKDQSFIDSPPLELPQQGVRFLFSEIVPEEGTITIRVAEKEENIKDFIVMQAIMFPWINILWVGIVVMGLGTGIAVAQRFRKNRT